MARDIAAWLAMTALAIMILARPGHSQDETPRNYALLIGINRYIAEIENVPKLDYAVKDAEMLTEILDDNGWDARAILDERARRESIIAELVRLGTEAREQDSVLIYFAGHGLRYKTGREHTYWLTYGMNLASLPASGIRMSHLLEYIADIPARRKILILDHCHSGDVGRVTGLGDSGGARGGAGELRVTRNLFPEQDFQRQVEERFAEGLVILGAARADAYEFKDLGHGLFTHGLLQAIANPETDTNGDGELSVSELWAYAKSELVRVANEKGVTQTPIEIIRGDGLMEWNLLPASGVDVERLARELRDLVGQINLEVDLDIRIMAAIFEAIRNWEDRVSAELEPDPKDRKIVEELKSIRDLGPELSTRTKKDILEATVRTLGLV